MIRLLGRIADTLPANCRAMHYENKARRDLRWWMLLIVGGMMFAATFYADPRNCDESGRQCAPWLIPIAKVVGGVFGLLGAGKLLANPSCGSAIDPKTGELVWWQDRVGAHEGKGGRLHPSQISRIRIKSDSDSDDVSLYDLAGERQAFFDGEVVPRPFETWAKRLVEKWPHIKIENV